MMIWVDIMLFDLSGREITRISHEDNYMLIKERLSDDEYTAIMDKLNDMIGEDEVHTSSWMPGKNWEGTVFQPIYETAAKGDFSLSGMFFGLLVWKAFMEHPAKWSFVKNTKEESNFTGMTYFPYRM